MTPIPLGLPEDILTQAGKKDENRLKIQEVLDGKKKLMGRDEGVKEGKVEKTPETGQIASENPPAAKEEETEIIDAKPEEHTPARAETTRQEVGPNEL